MPKTRKPASRNTILGKLPPVANALTLQRNILIITGALLPFPGHIFQHLVDLAGLYDSCLAKAPYLEFQHFLVGPKNLKQHRNGTSFYSDYSTWKSMKKHCVNLSNSCYRPQLQAYRL